MNYSKEVVHFVKMLSALQASPSNKPFLLSNLFQPGSTSYFSKSANKYATLESELLHSQILEPTSFHGGQFPEEYLETNGSGWHESSHTNDLLPPNFNVTQMFWTIMFSSMLSLACVGNIMVIWIVLAHRRMRTVTNYFLLNLSVADLTMASLNGAPNFVYMLRQDWIFGPILCVVNNFVANFTVASCVFTMTAISIDRYMAIVRPLHPRMTKGAAWRAIGTIWLCSAVLALPCLLYSTTKSYAVGSKTITQCFLHWPDGNPTESRLDFAYTVFLLILTYVIPMVAMAVCYGSMSKALWGHQQIGEVTERQINSMISKRKVVRMFIVIVLMFAFCWAPYHLYFIYIYYDETIVYERWTPSLFLSFYLLAMSTSMVNPIVYYFMNTRFRNYIQEVCGNFFCCTASRRRSRREFVGETPPLFRRYSHSYSRSRSGTADDNVQPLPKPHGNLVLQSHLHCYHNPMGNHNHNHSNHLPGNRNKRGKNNYCGPTRQESNAIKTCNTYC